jgi:hypothetical protein
MVLPRKALRLQLESDLKERKFHPSMTRGGRQNRLLELELGTLLARFSIFSISPEYVHITAK